MTSNFKGIAVALIGALTATTALAEAVGDVEMGQVYARMVCAECHATEKGQRQSPDPKAPAFSNVASTPGMTEMALRVWLRSSHPTMPNIVLTTKERDDVVAYIRSLNAPQL